MTENVTSFDVNKTIQLILTKALVRHGLLYILEKISAKDANILKNVVKNFDGAGRLYSALLEKYNVKSFRELTVKQRTEILEGLNQIAAERKVKNEDKVHGTRCTKGQSKGENV